MIKDIEAKNETIKINDKEIAVLKEHFPACFKQDGSFDIIRFQEQLKDKVSVVQEGYELKFLGKSYAKLMSSTDTTTIIQPDEVHNALPENANSQNIYISGDNIDGLKHLLKSYAGTIKCICIDPPYNTGSDGFVYFDNFKYTKETLQDKLSISEKEAARILDLTKRGSASHSAWLVFMYTRLLLARDLMTDDGVIFISIDDNEQANLKLLCDDVFGEEHFIGNLPRITKKAGKTTESIAKNNDYIICYSRTDDFKLNTYSHTDDGFKFSDEYEEERGKYKLNQTLDYGSIQYSKSLDYEIDVDGEIFRPGNVTLEEMNKRRDANPKSDYCWRWSKDLYEYGLKNGFIVVKQNGNKRIYTKTYQNASIAREGNVYSIEYIERSKSATSLDFIENEFSNDNSRKDLSKIFDTKVFDYSKPVSLLKNLIYLSTSKNDTVLDFFSGSATTAHAVLEQNLDDNGKRKFMAIQLPEKLDANNSSQQTAFNFLKENNLPTTLDYIGIERIKRAATKIKEEHPNKALDLGFKHFTLVEPNPNTLDKLETFDKHALLADTTILDDFGKPTLLTTWLNADGYSLTAKAVEVDLSGYTAYHCQRHLYLIDSGFSLESMKALIAKYFMEGNFNPDTIVIFGYSFNEWSINEMLEKNLRVLNDTEKNLKINFSTRY